MKKNNFIISIDQGTTSSRTILFNTSGNIVFKSQLEFRQFYPKDGWVEHNPEDIWKTTRKTLLNVINKSNKLKGNILTIGITNQRETTILWDKITGKPVNFARSMIISMDFFVLVISASDFFGNLVDEVLMEIIAALDNFIT